MISLMLLYAIGFLSGALIVLSWSKAELKQVQEKYAKANEEWEAYADDLYAELEERIINGK